VELGSHDANVCSLDMDHHFLDAQDMWKVKEVNLSKLYCWISEEPSP
tara:strand:+ start:3623 stop:3763 length:141 start_codon:yes stop_codon:yes gene_type:complete